MIGAGESSKDIGPTLPGFETCETATERWPTPTVGDSKNARNSTAMRHRIPPTGIHAGNTLTDAVDIFPPLTSSAAASPASPSVTPASAQENPIAAGFGLSSTESFAKLNPDGSWSRMYQGCGQLTMDGCLEEYSGTWPKRGTMRSGSTYPLPTSGRPTSESESSLWPTPNSEGGTGYMSGSKRDTWRPTLEGAAQISPSGPPPRITADGYRGKGRKAAMMWPTPKGSPEKFGRPRLNDRGDLQAAVWPTPMPSDVDGGRTTKGRHRQNETGLRVAAGGQLNPTWVEWLQGFPLGWTDLGDSVTPSSRRSRK